MAQKIVIASGKGGVGKSSLTVGLAFALRDLGKRVLAVDCDVCLRCLDLLLGAGDRIVFDWGDVLRGNCEADKAPVEACGVHLLAAPQSVSPDFTREKMRELLLSLDAQYDCILLDAPAGVSGEFLLAASGADMGILVATADDVCLRSAARAAQELRGGGLGELRLVLNRFLRPAMEHSFLRNIDDAIDRVGVQLLGVVPEDPLVTYCLPKGEPFPAKSPAKSAWLRIAKRLCGEDVPLRVR